MPSRYFSNVPNSEQIRALTLETGNKLVDDSLTMAPECVKVTESALLPVRSVIPRAEFGSQGLPWFDWTTVACSGPLFAIRLL